ncbi:MAG: WD40 repeat domain-containing protein, partial [Planctomycetota bacterium]
GLGRFSLEEDIDNAIAVWRFPTGQKVAELRGHEEHVRQLVFLQDGQTLASLGERNVRFWDLTKGLQQRSLPIAGNDYHTTSLLLPDAKTIVASGVVHSEDEARTARIVAWDLMTGDRRFAVERPERQAVHLAASPGGMMVACSLRPAPPSCEPFDDEILLLDAADGRPLLNLIIDDSRVTSLAFSADGKRLISGMDRGDALVWDVTAAYDRLNR